MKRRFLIVIILLLLITIPTTSYAKQKVDLDKDQHVIMAKEFLKDILDGKYKDAEKMFDANVASQINGEKLGEIWESLNSQVGPFVRAGKIAKEKQFPYYVVRIRMIFKIAILDLKVVFDRENKIAAFFFQPGRAMEDYKTPSYVKPDTYREKEIEFGFDEWKLPGTLTVPKGEGPFPCVVLVHGSGPNDRDEAVGECKPFKDLALGLASRGIAVLRYEKRTKQHGRKMFQLMDKLTVKEESIDDAAEAVKWLETQKEIDPKRIYVLGHSLGGMIFPRIGMLAPQTRGFIALAGATRPLDEIIVEQITYIYNLDGKFSKKEKENLEALKGQIKKLKTAKPGDNIPRQELPMGMSVTYWYSLKEINPVKEAAQMKQPLLIMQGGEDYQVTEKDFKNWKKGLKAKKNATLKYYPKLNHLFVESNGKSNPQEYFIPGHVDKQVVEDIAKWIKEN